MQRWPRPVVERASSRALAGGWSNPEFEEIAKALHRSAGLIFPANRRESAEAGMRRTMAAACLSDPRDLRQAVASAGETRDALITELTIGETFFFREPGQFEFIRSTVLPELRPIAASRRLRAWSAGCATGEEPYSIAMLLRETAWPGPASILGTDIATARLAAARRARYTAWSMRGVSDAIITRYFERRGKQFILRPDIRRSVEFGVLNLAAPEYPSAATGVEQLDIILCRNVLIYFDLATVAEIATRLIASLAPGGWLFLGASDPAIAELVPCEVVLTGAGIAYRPPSTASLRTFAVPPDDAWMRGTASTAFDDLVLPEAEWPAGVVASPVPAADIATPHHAADVTAEPLESYESAYEQGDYDAAAELARAATARAGSEERAWIVLVRSLANRGRLSEAGEACAAALESHRLSKELTHLHAILLAEGGRHAEAAAAARRALYLDPHFTVAHLALGDALARMGNVVAARRAFANAEAQLVGLDPESPVAGGDGAVVAQLLRIARFRLEQLGEPKRVPAG